ncbi:hypothetical protein BpHYR1_008919 [Brachionus plicatilis]|uniref:Uncharacterized protein n=1 Tax=Brachionus plicatilis TaxID=10195 RepID=A0A3M7RKL1_BRAPC|nr:hypothetical protein BpHYR1_008919 [Brachionus plicatilis]
MLNILSFIKFENIKLLWMATQNRVNENYLLVSEVFWCFQAPLMHILDAFKSSKVTLDNNSPLERLINLSSFSHLTKIFKSFIPTTSPFRLGQFKLIVILSNKWFLFGEYKYCFGMHQQRLYLEVKSLILQILEIGVIHMVLNYVINFIDSLLDHVVQIGYFSHYVYFINRIVGNITNEWNLNVRIVFGEYDANGWTRIRDEPATGIVQLRYQ